MTPDNAKTALRLVDGAQGYLRDARKKYPTDVSLRVVETSLYGLRMMMLAEQPEDVEGQTDA